MEDTQTFTFEVEVVPEEERDADPAAIGEVGRILVEDTKLPGRGHVTPPPPSIAPEGAASSAGAIVEGIIHAGYAIAPMYTGQRGGGQLLFEVVTQAKIAAQMLGADVYANRDMIGAVGNLVGIFGTLSTFVLSVFKRQKQPVKVSIVVDGEPITVEADNLKDAQAMLELAKSFHTAHPNVVATPQSKVKVRVAVPKKQRPKRR